LKFVNITFYIFKFYNTYIDC